MYKLKKEFKGQNVIVYTPKNREIRLEGADQKALETAFNIKGNEKFIEIDGKGATKVEEIKVKEPVKPIVRKGVKK